VKCDIQIDGSHDEYRFGIPFLEAFTTTYVYQAHDVVEGDPDYNITYLEIGVNGFAPAGTWIYDPWIEVEEGWDWELIIGIVIGSIIGVVVLGVWCYCCYKFNKC